MPSKLSVQEMCPAFTESIKEVFETMVFMPITVGAMEAKQSSAPQGAIAGSLGLTGDVMSVNLSLVFGMPLASAVFRAMMGMGEDDPVTPQEVGDVVGELANMMAGGAKTRLQDQHGMDFKLGLPSIVMGESLHVEPPKKTVTVVIPMTAEKGIFYLELSA